MGLLQGLLEGILGVNGSYGPYFGYIKGNLKGLGDDFPADAK